MAIYFLFAENSELERIFERRVEICMKRLDRLDDPIYNPISRQMQKNIHLDHYGVYAVLTVDTGSVDVIRLANAKSSHVVGLKSPVNPAATTA